MTEKETYRGWGYHPTEDARIFDIEVGGALPNGWYDSPARVPKNAAKAKPVKPTPEPVAVDDDEAEFQALLAAEEAEKAGK